MLIRVREMYGKPIKRVFSPFLLAEAAGPDIFNNILIIIVILEYPPLFKLTCLVAGYHKAFPKKKVMLLAPTESSSWLI